MGGFGGRRIIGLLLPNRRPRCVSTVPGSSPGTWPGGMWALGIAAWRAGDAALYGGGEATCAPSACWPITAGAAPARARCAEWASPGKRWLGLRPQREPACAPCIDAWVRGARYRRRSSPGWCYGRGHHYDRPLRSPKGRTHPGAGAPTNGTPAMAAGLRMTRPEWPDLHHREDRRHAEGEGLPSANASSGPPRDRRRRRSCDTFNSASSALPAVLGEPHPLLKQGDRLVSEASPQLFDHLLETRSCLQLRFYLHHIMLLVMPSSTRASATSAPAGHYAPVSSAGPPPGGRQSRSRPDVHRTGE